MKPYEKALAEYVRRRNITADLRRETCAAYDAMCAACPDNLADKEYKATCAAYDAMRAARIEKAAAYIAEKHIAAAAVPVVAAVLAKYAGKPAGEKTREKAAAEIASAVGANSAYFDSWRYDAPPTRVELVYCGEYAGLKPVVYAAPSAEMVDGQNRFYACDLTPVSLDGLPDDLDAWADEFERAAAELEAAKVAFENAVKNASRVNLGNARLPGYFVNS